MWLVNIFCLDYLATSLRCKFPFLQQRILSKLLICRHTITGCCFNFRVYSWNFRCGFCSTLFQTPNTNQYWFE